MKTESSARPLNRVASAVSGMRRVDCVKMVEDIQPRFFVVGVGHRNPVEREISPAVARLLMEEFPCRHEWRRRSASRG
jgi:hypothetical protein